VPRISYERHECNGNTGGPLKYGRRVPPHGGGRALGPSLLIVGVGWGTDTRRAAAFDGSNSARLASINLSRPSFSRLLHKRCNRVSYVPPVSPAWVWICSSEACTTGPSVSAHRDRGSPTFPGRRKYLSTPTPPAPLYSTATGASSPPTHRHAPP